MEEAELGDITITIAHTKTRQRGIVPELPCHFDRRSFGPEPHIGTVKSTVLLVRYG